MNMFMFINSKWKRISLRVSGNINNKRLSFAHETFRDFVPVRLAKFFHLQTVVLEGIFCPAAIGFFKAFRIAVTEVP
jgi:hypothetical protein